MNNINHIIIPKKKNTTIALRCSEDTLNEIDILSRHFNKQGNDLSASAIIRLCIDYTFNSIISNETEQKKE